MTHVHTGYCETGTLWWLFCLRHKSFGPVRFHSHRLHCSCSLYGHLDEEETLTSTRRPLVPFCAFFLAHAPLSAGSFSTRGHWQLPFLAARLRLILFSSPRVFWSLLVALSPAQDSVARAANCRYRMHMAASGLACTPLALARLSGSQKGLPQALPDVGVDRCCFTRTTVLSLRASALVPARSSICESLLTLSCFRFFVSMRLAPAFVPARS